MNPNGYRDRIIAELAAAVPGLTVVGDPAQVNPPCLHVPPIDFGAVTLNGSTAEVTLTVWILAVPPNDDRAARWCAEQLPVVLAALGGWDSAVYRLLLGQLPGYLITVSDYLEE
jgi:hypothetical protein